MYRLPLVFENGQISRLQDGDLISPSAFFQYVRYLTPTVNWQIEHGLGRLAYDIPYFCYGSNGQFFVGIDEDNSTTNITRLNLTEPTTGILIYLNVI